MMRDKIEVLWEKYSLSFVLLILFLTSWAAQAVIQYPEFMAVEMHRGRDPSFSEFLLAFWSATLENWQSEFLQLLVFVWLTTRFIHKGSYVTSRKEIVDRLTEIEVQLKGLNGKGKDC